MYWLRTTGSYLINIATIERIFRFSDGDSWGIKIMMQGRTDWEQIYRTADEAHSRQVFERICEWLYAVGNPDTPKVFNLNG